MSFTERLASPPVRNELEHWLNALPDSERDAFYKMVRDPEWKHVDILDAITEEGGPAVPASSFRDWRRRAMRTNA